ncbi:hypothetical protein EJD97_000666 [Solanum chilense]|uniref:Uncharacterized protein n=1 Tax=Solanum chilense TaxID=4083 RepID=A0A6N2APW6_SOLCI|nr:hypothetical protein EJD97_000666 [Solanum chilense]
MSIASGLVEAYVMKKLHEEKTKNLEKIEAITHENCNQSKKSSSSSSSSSSSGDWFTKMFKKVQPVTAPSSDSATKS